MPRKLSCLPMVLMIALGCSSGPRKTVGVVPKGANHQFWQTVHAGAIKAAWENNLDIEWNSPPIETDASRQIAIVESMITRKLAAIVLAPVDRKALVSVVERASRAGIPVVIFDSDLDSAERVAFVATDNREGGRIAARRLAELLGEQGKLAYIGFVPGSAATLEREEGFFGELKQKYPKMQVVQTAYGMADRSKAMAAMENIMTAHPDLAGVFADNESSSVGTVLAMKSRATTKIRSVLFDANPQLIDDLRDRYIDGLVVQNPFRMGYEATRAAAQKMQGIQPMQRLDSGVTLVTRVDLEKPDVIELLYPDIKKYLEGKPPRR